MTTLDSSLHDLLLVDNPWLAAEVLPGDSSGWYAARLPDRLVRRQLSKGTRERWRLADRAHLVVGPRQAGKSTTMRAHFAEIGEPALFLDCEQPLIREWCRSAPLFLQQIETQIGEPVPLFFDEAQHLDEAGLFVKGLVDRSWPRPIFVTGSSSFHLGAKTRESLAGRATRTRVLPFTLAETLQDLSDLRPVARADAVHRRLERHWIYGGYPEVWLADEPEPLLLELVEAIILRDASDLFRIGRPDAFRRLLRLAAHQVGSLVNLSEWAGVLGISRDTVSSYLEILASSHVTVTLPPFAGGKRSEITSQPKIYVVDNGIRHQVLRNFEPSATRVDRGAVVENWVFGELWKALPADATLHFWRSAGGAEVDFVVVRGDVIVGIEVKAGGQTEKIPRGARSFVDAYRPAVLAFACGRPGHRTTLGSTDVRWIPFDAVASLVRELFPA
ncbi:MAG: ATP-binding protein [Acidobacteriota bacterium]